MNNTPKIVIVGTGKVAFRLAKRLKSKGLPLSQVIGRSADSAALLASELHCPWTNQWDAILPDADWVLIAVSDDAIDEIAAQLFKYIPDVLVTHTSGATPSDVLAPYFNRFGVFYPLQSFTKERQPVWSKIPFCVDASTQ